MRLMKNNDWLKTFKSNVYSQCGEDGVINKILEILPANNKWAVEFGAWDGKYLSNTYNLVKNYGYSCVLIEGDVKRYQDLKGLVESNKSIIVKNRYVDSRGKDSLDKILIKTKIPKNFDVLSIDIDGNDYHVWKNLKTYKPKIICIEFNPTIPNEIKFVQPDNKKYHQGASLLALYNLGKILEYELVCVLDWNAIFIDKQYYSLFGISNNQPSALNHDQKHITHIFFGYDGKVFIRGMSTLTWHNISFDENELQILPKIIRKYPGEYNRFEFYLYRIYLRTRKFKNKVIKWINSFKRHFLTG